MPARDGFSLTEVLVATVLLAVGIGGALGALLVSAQLRVRASAREAVADAVQDRLAWFEAQGCVTSDTILRSADGVPVVEAWRVTRDARTARFEGMAWRHLGSHGVRFSLLVRRDCP